MIKYREITENTSREITVRSIDEKCICWLNGYLKWPHGRLTKQLNEAELLENKKKIDVKGKILVIRRTQAEKVDYQSLSQTSRPSFFDTLGEKILLSFIVADPQRPIDLGRDFSNFRFEHLSSSNTTQSEEHLHRKRGFQHVMRRPERLWRCCSVVSSSLWPDPEVDGRGACVIIVGNEGATKAGAATAMF